MFEKFLWLALPIVIVIYPLPVVIIFLVSDNLEQACLYTAVGEMFLAIWFGAISFLFDVFKEWRRQLEKRKKAEGDV